jgi:uncharacterized protein YjbI with pentapeptide repeats
VAAIAWAALRQVGIASGRHHAQTVADQQRRITESFSKAVEQLGNDKIATRLGGIYTLERISRESTADYWTVMETLTAFVRERARWKESDEIALYITDRANENKTATGTYDSKFELDTDVAAVITVLSRREVKNRNREKSEGWRINLRRTDLRGAFLRGAHLERAFLTGAHLEGADLREAHLEGAILKDAHFYGANLREAHLEGAFLGGARLAAALVGAHLEEAFLVGAHFEGAFLRGAHLKGANLGAAHLERAYLQGADLSETVGLTPDQLAGAHSDIKTVLPQGVTRPTNWPSA